jgi:hypothetical protein
MLACDSKKVLKIYIKEKWWWIVSENQTFIIDGGE